jgi:hypothetical protein
MAIRQLTLRGFDKELERRLREEARAGDLSLNRAALRLLRRGAGLERAAAPNVVGDALNRLIGTWSDGEERAFGEATAVFERVDKGFWR